MRSKSNKSQLNNKSIIISRKDATSSAMRKDFKRMNTNMSRVSRVSKGSGKSLYSTKSRANSSRRY